ncbi:hypothetical protein ACFPAF_00320 [Hymenobacter endophyticus]|uniref:XRE family transcriptional regulator n=1 Tax=Hymenobacter endophyticus TaxID=3076335 RepID=A0ABU3TBS5_9BACT|nr:hypothetical protein [Hymenobacter endophyticus]MDU0368822.1 hypothetical protein [Hymenobacter endophyticus]
MFVKDKQMSKMENTSVGQRFTQLINHLGISKNAFAMSLDKTATVIQHLVEERNKPGFDLICKVFEVYPNVSKDWLLQGSGPMLIISNEVPKAEKLVAKPARTAAEFSAAPIVPAEVTPAEAAALPVAESALAPAPVPATPVPAEPPTAPAPEPVTPVAPATPEPVVALPPAAPAGVAPAVAAAPVASDAGAWQTALYTQQMAHQLALAEMRNQHLQDQQRLMQQMMDLMQRKMM